MTRITRRPLLLIDEHRQTADRVAEAIDGLASVVRCRLSMARAFLQSESYAAILMAVPDTEWLSLAPMISDFSEEASTLAFCAAPDKEVALAVVRRGGQDGLAGADLTPDRITRVVRCAIVRGDEVSAMRVRARSEKKVAVRIVAAVIRDALQPAMTTLSRALEHPHESVQASREALGAIREVMLDLDEAGLAM